MSDMPGRVVLTPNSLHPYKVVLNHPCEGQTEFAVSTIREGEALIREKAPPAAPPVIHRVRLWTGETVAAEGPAIVT